MVKSSTALPPWVEPALKQAAGLMRVDPDKALLQLELVQQRAGFLPPAELLACQALRQLGRMDEAFTRLDALARSQPAAPPPLWWELAQCASEAGRSQQAIAALERLTSMAPAVASGWFLLARELRKINRHEDAWRADLSGIHASTSDSGLVAAAMAMNEGRLEQSEEQLNARLAKSPDDPAAIRQIGRAHV